jgi:DNA-binding NarL/FixJ family response regulator
MKAKKMSETQMPIVLCYPSEKPRAILLFPCEIYAAGVRSLLMAEGFVDIVEVKQPWEMLDRLSPSSLVVVGISLFPMAYRLRQDLSWKLSSTAPSGCRILAMPDGKPRAGGDPESATTLFETFAKDCRFSRVGMLSGTATVERFRSTVQCLLAADGIEDQVADHTAASDDTQGQALTLLDPKPRSSAKRRRQGGYPLSGGGFLTPRELEVLHEISKGSTNKEIAMRLTVSTETVKIHVQTILRKLAAESRTHAAIWAIRNGVC